MSNYDFSGWATRHNLKCSDGRTIIKDAFKHNNGKVVPLVWNHQHDDPEFVLGHALLESRDEGMYAYCSFNDTEKAQSVKKQVEHGDIVALSIYANQLKQKGANVMHGMIREVSLVLAGANPGAYIDSIICHGDDSEDGEAWIFMDKDLSSLSLGEEPKTEVVEETSLSHAEEAKNEKEEGEQKMAEQDKTVKEVFEGAMAKLSEEEQNVIYAIVGAAAEGNEDEGEDGDMKHNLFDQDERYNENVLTHADQTEIIKLAKSSGVGSLKAAIEAYSEQNSLAHGIDGIEELFPDYKDVYPGAPERITNDMDWVNAVIKKMHKSPISRIRTRQADTRGVSLKAKGYKKGEEKAYIGNIKLQNRTTDPQTIYVKDKLNRDDIIDITDFDVVKYQYDTMKEKLYEEIALAVMVGDGREDGDADKIEETHVRSIWNDDELYTIHVDVDLEAAKAKIQGTNTSLNFSENYILAEAIVEAALYGTEQYKGKGALDFYCTPHTLNVMSLSRDLNGRRIYDSKSDLAKALNVTDIYTAEQFEGLVRTTKDGKKKKLLGILVNLGNYSAGSTKGGEITQFSQFDIDFNQEKYLIETRMSGALTRIKSAIVLEEDVTDAE